MPESVLGPFEFDQGDLGTTKESEREPANSQSRIQIEGKQSLTHPTRSPGERNFCVTSGGSPTREVDLVVEVIDREDQINGLSLSHP